MRPAGRTCRSTSVNQTLSSEGERIDAALVRAHPLAAIIDEGRVVQMCGERPAADPVLRLEHEHVDAVAIEKASGEQPR